MLGHYPASQTSVDLQRESYALAGSIRIKMEKALIYFATSKSVNRIRVSNFLKIGFPARNKMLSKACFLIATTSRVARKSILSSIRTNT